MPDPLQLLSVDCANAIFEHLSVSDLGQCERVSRGWALFVRQWMVSPGLRLHYLHELATSNRYNLERSIRYFKEQGMTCTQASSEVANNPVAAVQRSIGRGEPSAVQKYENAKSFTVAGNYCAWTDKEAVFWQDLSSRSNGSLHPVMKLDAVGVDGARHERIQLGANGHLLIRSTIDPAPNDAVPANVLDILVCLESASQV
jgi:hypothetical protein